MEQETIYLDHAAATPLDTRVLKAMQPYFADKFYNPSSPYAQAVEVKRDYNDAKHCIAQLISGKPAEITMTAGATESINLAFSSIGGHIVTSSIEHESVLRAAAREEHTIVPVDLSGVVKVSEIERAITPQTRLVSVALANNELGTLQPVKEIAQVVRRIRAERRENGGLTPIYLHCDASQGVGQIDISVTRLGVDLLTINSGKVYGPKQVGLLWASSEVELKPQIVGGGQEKGLRSGTENVAGVIGFAKALELVEATRKSETKRLTNLRDGMQRQLEHAFSEIVFLGNQRKRLAGHLHVSFPGLDGERLVFRLERRGVLLATGSACAANQNTRSHVLVAMGVDPVVADGSLRISLGHLSNEANIKRATDLIIEEVSAEYKRVGLHA